MAQISWTKKSVKDLRAINNYISLDSTFYAARLLTSLSDELTNYLNSLNLAE